MGASTSWIAVRGKPRPEVLEELGLEIGDASGAKAQGCDFPEGWYVVGAAGYGNPLTHESVLARLSAGCEVIEGGADTRVMCSTASGWADGQRIWRVEHNNDRGIDDLASEGELPPVFRSICDSLRSRQDAEGSDGGIDFIFDAPIKLCQALTGYHYDESMPDEDWHLLFPTSNKS